MCVSAAQGATAVLELGPMIALVRGAPMIEAAGREAAAPVVFPLFRVKTKHVNNKDIIGINENDMIHRERARRMLKRITVFCGRIHSSKSIFCK